MCEMLKNDVSSGRWYNHDHNFCIVLLTGRLGGHGAAE